jgi:hypothetical protein
VPCWLSLPLKRGAPTSHWFRNADNHDSLVLESTGPCGRRTVPSASRRHEYVDVRESVADAFESGEVVGLAQSTARLLKALVLSVGFSSFQES